MNLVGSVIGALFFDGAVFNIITVTSLHRAPLSPAGCDFFNCGKAGMRLFNATFLKTRTLGGLLVPETKKNYSMLGRTPSAHLVFLSGKL